MLSFNVKVKVGCACLIVLVMALWVLGPKSSVAPPNPPAVVENAPAVIYTFEQQQGAFKLWLKDFEAKNNAVNEQWESIGEILKDTEQQGIYEKLDAGQDKLEKLQGTYSSLQPPKELTIEQQKVLKQVSNDMNESIIHRIKFIKFTEGYLLHQKTMMYRQSQEEKELIDLYQANCSVEIKKLAEIFNVQ